MASTQLLFKTILVLLTITFSGSMCPLRVQIKRLTGMDEFTVHTMVVFSPTVTLGLAGVIMTDTGGTRSSVKSGTVH